MKLSKTTAPFLALLLAASAYAVENTEVDAKAKLWYQTGVKDSSTLSMFEQAAAVGQFGVDIGVKTDLLEGLKGTARATILDTLGLENSTVKDMPSAGAGHESGDYYSTQAWISEAFIDYKTSNTSIVAGRQALNTPLLFTERWNTSYNTFDAAVVINSDLPNTTLVAAYVAQHNGGAHAGNKTATAFPSTTMHNGSFHGFGTTYNDNGGTRIDGTITEGNNGAYALGAMIKPIENIELNIWYYNIDSLMTAHWVDASYKESGLFVGIQNSGIDVETPNVDNAMVTAVQAGYTVDKLNVNISYSTTDEGSVGTATIANAATGDKSKVYTQAVFQDGGVVGYRDTTAMRLGASYKFDSVKVTALFQNTESGAHSMKKGTEIDIIAAAKINANVDLKGIYVNRDVDMRTDTDFKQQAIRFIASVKF